MDHLPVELRLLVHQSVEILGRVIEREIGADGFQIIESLRAEMASLRSLGHVQAIPILRKRLEELRQLKAPQRLAIARSFTLMLEMMNACENAYRSHRIAEREVMLPKERPDSIVYVLTAHPTEARSPANIETFHQILLLLIPVFRRKSTVLTDAEREGLSHGLEMAWHTSIVREKKPKVQDEADHIYSTLLRDETLSTLLKISREVAPVYLRTWVGGDKDGHPGVDEVTFLASLASSRKKIIEFCRHGLACVRDDLHRIGDHSALIKLKEFEHELLKLKALSAGDAKAVVRVRKLARSFMELYLAQYGYQHPRLIELKSLFHIFPALVVPLEFRESSDVLESDPTGKSLAIVRMLRALKKLSSVHDPRWYVRGFIVSMTSELKHIEAAAEFIKKVFGELSLPVIPLFEQSAALLRSPEIVEKMIKSPLLGTAIRTKWNGRIEMMLGYSDSSKESGVLRSRVQVAETMHRLDHLCRRLRVTPVFFQGSGGSTDRGGGSIEEQTSWWPAGALRNYKVTVQGEMVERSLASPEITRGQIEKIVQMAGLWREAESRKLYESEGLNRFADRVADVYQAKTHDREFLAMVGAATPYSSLDLLRIGSRPTKRSTSVSVESLRAIPWVLCWTQTRTLFPTWWGVGTAWAESNQSEREEILETSRVSPVVASYVKALGYTMAKVRLSIFRLYLDESSLTDEAKQKIWAEFTEEFDRTLVFVKAALGENLVAWRPWLEDSIHLRSPMIHPLNLLQILAMKDHDDALFRLTVTGISSGMMTTG